MTKAKSGVPEGLNGITPQLTFDDTARAIDWYKKTFNAKELSRSKGADGKILHAALQIGNTHVYMNDAMGGAKPATHGSNLPITLWIYFDNCDEPFNRAVSTGAKVDGPMGQLADQFWGDRTGAFVDPFGYRWCVATHKEDLTREELDHRAADFFKNQPQPTHA